MGPSTLARYPPFIHNASFTPSAPIPIPHVRRVTDPPPRSPTRYQTSSDLIFEMSPHVVNETPLTSNVKSFVYNDFNSGFAEKSSLPTAASRFGYVRKPTVNVQPYAEEPFLFSIPHFPSLPRHARTQSAATHEAKQDINIDEVRNTKISPRFSSSLAIKPLPSIDAQSLRYRDTSNPDHDFDEVLTTAFQQSFTTKTSSIGSFLYSSATCFDEPISPPASVDDEKGTRSIRIPSILRKKSYVKTTAMPAAIRTSVAEPVVSFAQAELKHSPTSGVIARVVHASKGSRARSPYPARGRRSSLLRSCGNKISDDDLACTLENNGLSEKPGLECFLPGPLARRHAMDESKLADDLLERGRTRSRVRAARQL